MKPRYVPQTGFGNIPHGYVTTTGMPKQHMHNWQETCLVGERRCLVCGTVVTFDHREGNMPSINDWAAKAAERIVYGKNGPISEERIAAIIATFAEPLVALLRESRREHLHVEDDTWYCCGACTHECESDDPGHEHSEGCCVSSHDNVPKRVQGVCDCGAAAWNARLDAALAGERPASR